MLSFRKFRIKERQKQVEMVHGLHLDENVSFFCVYLSPIKEKDYPIFAMRFKVGLGNEQGWRNTPFSGFHEE